MGQTILPVSLLLVCNTNCEQHHSSIKELRQFVQELHTANSNYDGLSLYKKHLPDIVILEIEDGLSVASIVRQINPSQIIFFTTNTNELSLSLQALDFGANGYFVKPIDMQQLQDKILQFSKQITAKKEIYEHQKMLEEILHRQSVITLVTDFKDIKFASDSLWDLLYVKNIKDFFSFHDSILELFVEHKNYLYGKNAQEFMTAYNQCPSDMRLVSIITENGPTAFHIGVDKYTLEDDFFVVSLADITSLQSSRLIALHQASYDKLTNIYNRHAFATHLERELSKAHRYGRNASIALIDVDHFKKCNDTYGHIVGDEILVQITTKISSIIRNSDIFARWGGEEFVLFLNETDIDKAKLALEKIRHSVEELYHPVAGRVSVSIGATQIEAKDTPSTLFERCDKALYRAKAQGRNQVMLSLPDK